MRTVALILLPMALVLSAAPSWAGGRHSHRHGPQPVRAWIGVGTGIAIGSVDIECSGGGDCSESGPFQTYSANVTIAGPMALRLRGIRAAEDESNGRTPYETAALLGGRFGRSNWYGLVGAGRIRHPDDNFRGDASGFAWEILFAPSGSGGAGLELSFQGNAGEEVDFAAFNLGMRFGALR